MSSTAVVDLNSDLVRRKWMREGMLQATSKSYWSPMTGTSTDSVIVQANNEMSSEGHTVVFDFDGNISKRAIRGKDTAFGRGEQKKKFSDKITVERYRLVVDNGDKFDGVNIGDLTINEHTDSRNRLADLFIRFKDQSCFDSLQGLLTTNDSGIQTPSHIIDTGSEFGFNTLLDIERTLKTSQGFTTGGIRRPIEPYMMNGDMPMWMFVIDASMANKLRRDVQGYQTLVANGDMRGEGNRNFKGMIGKLGSLMIMEAPDFFGTTSGSGPGWRLDDSDIEMCGMRQFDAANNAWTGQEGFDYAETLHSRGLVLGKMAGQMAFGKMPDYKWQPSQDFAIKSESAVEFWMETQKLNMSSENRDYDAAKVADLDYGVIAVDVEI